MDKTKNRLTIREMVLFSLLGALTFAGKMAMAGLPQIEPVSLFVMLFSVTFGKKALFPIYVYVSLEFLFWPIGMWNLNYLYVWLILAFAAYLLRRMRSRLGWAILSGSFGLLFGLFSAPVYAVTGGLSYAVTWWVSGIPHDLFHCTGNFFIALVLFPPLRSLLERLYRKYM